MNTPDAPLKDAVAQLPEDIARYQHLHKKLPDGVKLEPGFTCVWNDRYFIHTRAVLPLLDLENGIGFGLWVEVAKEDFDRYSEAVDDDEKYKIFRTDGMLANEWPGFEGAYGLKVVVRTIKMDQKVYITEVLPDHPIDPLLQVSFLAQKGDEKTKESIRNVVVTWMGSNPEN